MTDRVDEGSSSPWRVLKVEPENQSINSLYLERSSERFANRRAGQYASLRIPRGSEWSEPHPFTISCAPEDDGLRFTIKKQGEFTSSIPDLSPGTEVKVAGPFGTFCNDVDEKDSILLIAGGVGITPFLSVLRHSRNKEATNRVTLFWVNRTMEDTFAGDELKEMTGTLDFTLVYVLSRETDARSYFNPDIPEVLYETGHLERDLLSKYAVSRDASAYVCGPLKMQEAVIGELEALGIDRNSVETESFTYEPR
ncbi:MAG: FAD/NAD-binding family oxidoreductase [Dehalococcoidia bacterium]